MAEKKTTKKSTAEVAKCEEVKKAPAKRSCGATKKAALGEKYELRYFIDITGKKSDFFKGSAADCPLHYGVL